jgi:hypothetical protein
MHVHLKIRIAWPPPHSNRFLQPIDLPVISGLNQEHQFPNAKVMRPKLQGKILRAHRAWHQAMHPLIGESAWRKGAISRIMTSSTAWGIDEQMIAKQGAQNGAGFLRFNITSARSNGMKKIHWNVMPECNKIEFNVSTLTQLQRVWQACQAGRNRKAVPCLIP